jgi:FkbM family methyltransferase
MTMQFGSLTLKRCKYGWMLFAGPYIGRCFDLYGQYSESEVAMMRSFLAPGSTIIDVGANIGDLTLPLSLMAAEAGKVFAFESNPEVFNVLCANLALNQVRNTLPINAFVTGDPATDTASPSWGKFAYVSERWPTQFVAIDSLDLDRLDLIKVDVDGKELEVLQSGAMQIERFRPMLYFENDVREASAPLLGFLMDDLGYDLYWHAAPIFDENNFFGNPVNHWAPKNIVSMMVVAVPRERKVDVPGLSRILSKDEWWNLTQ